MVTDAPAYYAARPGRLRDWWTLLHPPYTAWHLSYVAIGAAFAPRFDGGRLLATLVAFLAAVGVAAHALDELHGHPLRTAIPDAALAIAAGIGLTIAVVIGIVGVSVVGPELIVFVLMGPLLVLGYNLELFGGRLHTDLGFAIAWGAFPVLTAYYAQAQRVDAVALLAAAGAVSLSFAQRVLSNRARDIRRRVERVSGTMTARDGTTTAIDRQFLLAPTEHALRAMSWAVVALAVAAVLARATR